MEQAVLLPDTRPLFPILDRMLLDLLRELSPDDWQRQTIARLWRVKDVAAHLLDGNLRILSIQREGYFGEAPPPMNGYADLVAWLNQLNADWVKACRRLSPNVLILLHEATGPLVSAYFAGLDPEAPAVFPVAWAGESQSVNRLHVAREYTEKWLHQQQIRDAVGRLDDLLAPELFGPFMDTFAQGLPHACRDVEAPAGTTLQLAITAPAEHRYLVVREPGQWRLAGESAQSPAATAMLDADTAWRLFSKSLRPDDVRERVRITGNTKLAEAMLGMVAVMA